MEELSLIKSILHPKLNMYADSSILFVHIFKLLLIKIKKMFLGIGSLIGYSWFVPSPCSNLETMTSRLGNT
jgi:hypothetical protein